MNASCSAEYLLRGAILIMWVGLCLTVPSARQLHEKGSEIFTLSHYVSTSVLLQVLCNVNFGYWVTKIDILRAQC